MYDVIIYATLATIVCVIFYSVLGKNVGMGPDNPFDPKDAVETKPKAAANGLGVIDGGLSKDETGLGAIARFDPAFSPAQFMNGAKAAYSMVLEAFANGDREVLGELLNDEVYAVYDAAIREREAKNQKQVTDLGRLRKTSILNASLNGSEARIEVLYEAELTSALFDEGGNLLQGNPDILSAVSEVWEYERNMKSKDPTWKLASVAPSEGDDLAADPSPDTKPSDTKPSGTKRSDTKK